MLTNGALRVMEDISPTHVRLSGVMRQVLGSGLYVREKRFYSFTSVERGYNTVGHRLDSPPGYCTAEARSVTVCHAIATTKSCATP